MIRGKPEQVAYEKSLHPGLTHGWEGGTNIGFALALGNSQTENLALAFNAIHPTQNDKLTMSGSAVYTRNDAPSASPQVVANLVQCGIRYDPNLRPRVF